MLPEIRIQVEDLLKYWIALNLVLAERAKESALVRRVFSDITHLFKTGKRDLITLGLKDELAEALTSSRTLKEAEKIQKKCSRDGVVILTRNDSRYPRMLREIFDPPDVLYCKGQVEVLHKPAVAIVGSRNPSPYGRLTAERLAEDLSSRGLVIVSGLARGIDSAAHWGALRGGETAAVLGSGIEVIYPKENSRMASEIAEKGVVITEYPPRSRPLGYHFPMRNRIISGLSLACVVVEAARRSGSLITARLALEQGREVMAVPGKVTSELSWGPNWLIKSGAKLVQNWEDVAEELPSPWREDVLVKREEEITSKPTLTVEEKKILAKISPDSPVHIDELVEESEWSISEMLSHLLNLELKGYVKQLAGKNFIRKDIS